MSVAGLLVRRNVGGTFDLDDRLLLHRLCIHSRDLIVWGIFGLEVECKHTQMRHQTRALSLTLLALQLSDPYRRNSYRRQPRSTNDFLEYHSHVYQQRQRERAAARSNPPTRNLEQSQRFYEAAGMRSSTQELRQQLQSQLASRSEPDLRYVHPDVLDELRASERERRDAIVIANLRRQGLM